MPVFGLLESLKIKILPVCCGMHWFPNSFSLCETFHWKFGGQKPLWSFPSFIIMICHRLQTCISLYSGWRDHSRTVNRSSLSCLYTVAMWTLKKGLGRLAPLGNFGTDPLQVMFTKRQVEFTCYVNSAERTKFLFFSCVVVSLSLSFSLFPCYPFDFYMKLSLKLVSTTTPCMSWI